MSLDRFDDCPLKLDLQPGCPSCLECKFHLSKDSENYSIECRLDRLSSKIVWKLKDYKLGDSLSEISYMIMAMAVKEINNITTELPPLCAKCHQWECVCVVPKPTRLVANKKEK